MTDVSHVPYRLASKYIKDRLANYVELQTPQIGIICGSGLSGLSDTLAEPKITIQYSDIPGFPKSSCSVQGHMGEVVIGVLHNVVILCFRGRFHSYEGYDMKTVVLPIHVLRCLGVKVCIVTNAAGGLNPSYNVGDVIVVSDHIAIPTLAGKNPLIGINDNELGPRFPPMSNAYSSELRTIATQSAQQLNYKFVHGHGTYCFVSGPMYESCAECQLLKSFGGDTVGMSTVPEIISAHHCSIKVLCLSLVTNKVIMPSLGNEQMNNTTSQPVASHAEVLEATAKRTLDLQALVKQIIINIQKDYLPTLPALEPISLTIPNDLLNGYYKTMNEQRRTNGVLFDTSTVLLLSACSAVVAAAVTILVCKTNR
jgi:purine-nucleoside phosphorylase